MNYFPLTLPFCPGLAAILTFLAALIEVNILTYAFQKMGMPLHRGFALLIGSLHGLGAPVASIGGAGTFDGISLTRILAVLLTATPSAMMHLRSF